MYPSAPRLRLRLSVSANVSSKMLLTSGSRPRSGRARPLYMVKSRQTFLRRKDDGAGKQAADESFLRLLVATGQPSSLGESVYLRDFLDSIIAYPESKVRDGRILASTDLDADYDVVDTESKALLARNGRKGKESLHFLLVRCLFLFFVIDTHSAHCQIAKTIR